MSDWVGALTVGIGWVYYKGPVGHTDFHQHYAVQICFPHRGSLRVETREKSQTVETVLVIGSNVSHRLSSASPTAELLYIEPKLAAQNAARLNMNDVMVLDLPAAQMKAIRGALDIDPKRLGADFGRRIASLIWPDGPSNKAFSPIDPRITETLEQIDACEDLNLRLGQLVAGSGLSASRFRHLFSAQVGMSLKSYLLWTKLQRAIQHLATDSSLTRAAHMAGFSDSAHLSRTFRRTFGLAPDDLNRNADFTTRKTGA